MTEKVYATAIKIIESEIDYLKGSINASYDKIDRANQVADHCGTDIPADTYTEMKEVEAEKRIVMTDTIIELQDAINRLVQLEN